MREEDEGRFAVPGPESIESEDTLSPAAEPRPAVVTSEGSLSEEVISRSSAESRPPLLSE
jgi:hypothetical protein